MKKICFIVCCLFLTASEADAQHLFGYFSYDEVLKQIPEYVQEMAALDSLKNHLDAEMARVEKDFNEKYEEFLDGQKEFPAIILQKRQLELQEMMDKNVAFRDKARRAYRQAEQEAENRLRERINDAVRQVGAENGYAVVLNTDGNVCPWIDGTKGTDVTSQVLEKLKLGFKVLGSND